MDVDISTLVLWVLIGAAVSAVTLIVMELATGEQFGFAFKSRQPPLLVPVAVSVRIVAGPAIVARTAYDKFSGGRDDGVVPLTLLLLALLWSLATGWAVAASMSGLF